MATTYPNIRGSLKQRLELNVGNSPPLGQGGQGAHYKGKKSPEAEGKGACVQADVDCVLVVVLLAASRCHEYPHVSCAMPAVCAVLAHTAGGAGRQRPGSFPQPSIINALLHKQIMFPISALRWGKLKKNKRQKMFIN